MVLGTDPISERDELISRINCAITEVPLAQQDVLINAINTTIVEHYETRA